MAETVETRVEVLLERELPRGWSYTVLVHRASGDSEHEVSLGWVDHDYWCGGRLPPSRTVQMVLEYVLARFNGHPLPRAFDAARARRWFPQIDRELPGWRAPAGEP